MVFIFSSAVSNGLLTYNFPLIKSSTSLKQTDTAFWARNEPDKFLLPPSVNPSVCVKAYLNRESLLEKKIEPMLLIKRNPFADYLSAHCGWLRGTEWPAFLKKNKKTEQNTTRQTCLQNSKVKIFCCLRDYYIQIRNWSERFKPDMNHMNPKLLIYVSAALLYLTRASLRLPPFL